MPKKPPARHVSNQHRPQPKKKDVLVRANSATEIVAGDEEEETEAPTTVEPIKAGETKTKPSSEASKAAPRPPVPAGKRPETTAKTGAQPTRALPASQRAGRPGRRPGARPGSRITVGRQANLVSAEHYRYTLKDLRFIAVLAVIMFAIIVALTFILPRFLPFYQ